MKFLKTEYDSIKSKIDASQYEYADFTFVKRKGRLYVQYKKLEPTFSFFRKKETRLEGNKFIERKLFDLYTDQPKGTVESWEEVLMCFEQWLANLT